MPFSPTTTNRAFDPDTISGWIDTFAELTENGPGVTRLAYTALERQAHAVFASRMRELGLSVATDPAGNTIAELAPTHPTPLPAIGTGSHLDSVPSGGRFDGIAGVVTALEVAEAAVRSPNERRRPWRFVVFAAEEGARFGQACNGSRMIAGLTTAADLHRFTDESGTTMAEAMRSVGLDPDVVNEAKWDPSDWFAFLELHIEQGAVLESLGLPVGIVDAISGSTRLAVSVEGQATHTGGTPMHLRKDALVTAARCVLACNEIARDPAHHGTRATVGRLTVRPGSITTVPGRVDFTVDVRDVDNDRQRRTAEALEAEFSRLGGTAGTPVRISLMGDTSPVMLPSWITDHLVSSAKDLGLGYRILASGASHDSQQINRITPTGMVFVPSAAGLSHVPEEFTSTAQLAEGTRLVYAAMTRLDAVA